jgi:hypothetical protein
MAHHTDGSAHCTIHTAKVDYPIFYLAALIGAGALGYGAQQLITSNFREIEAWTAITASGLLFWTAWFCHGAAQHFQDIKSNIVSRGSLAVLAVPLCSSQCSEKVQR